MLPSRWCDARLQIGVAAKALPHRGAQFGGEASSLVDMVAHQAPHLVGIAPSRRFEQTVTRRDVRVAEPLGQRF